ncbi:MAG: hypothetical protein H8E70_04390 [Candidatus Marinimicrobia bacterium]|nr:hypothetical protein [Candidatus Neomarinimicrobiota bacterium]
MIYLSFNESSLLCSVWSQQNDKPFLTQITLIPLTGDLDAARGDDSKFNAILEQAFKALSSEIQLDGHDAYVTIPDYWAHHDFTEVDANMGSDDSWEFILWQKDQRLGEKAIDYLTYAENIQGNVKHVVHLPTLLMSDIKLSISEYGAEPIWLGTESMAFTGPTKRTYGVISEAGNGYDLFVIKGNGLYAGSARQVKGEWKVSKSFGFKSDLEEILTIYKKTPRKNLSPVYTLDRLSEKKQAHWTNNKLQHIKPFDKVSVENADDLDKMPYHLLAIQSIMVDAKFSQSNMNLFSAAGLIEKIEAPQIEEKTIQQKDKVKPKKKKKVNKRKSFDLQNVVVVLTTIIILLSFAMSIYLKKSEDNTKTKRDEIIQKIIPQEEKVKSVNEPLQIFPQPLMDIMQNSISMMKGMQYVFEKFPFKNVIFLSVSERDLQLEIVNGEEIGVDLLPLGSMINYNVKGIECCEGFKHFYDFLLPETSEILSTEIDSTESLQASFSNLNVQVEKLDSIDKGKFKQTPYILKANSEEKMKAAFSVLLQQNHNISLRKAVVKTNPESRESQSVFYISVFEYKGD